MAFPILSPLSSLSSPLLDVLKATADQGLRTVSMVILTSRYAFTSFYLEDFQLATRDKDVKDVLFDFRNLIPLTSYEPNFWTVRVSYLKLRTCLHLTVQALLEHLAPRLVAHQSSLCDALVPQVCLLLFHVKKAASIWRGLRRFSAQCAAEIASIS